MKTSIILLALSLALSASAAPQATSSQAASVNEDFRFGHNRNGGGKKGGNNNNNNQNGGNAGSNQNAGGAAGSGSNNANGGSAAGSNSTSTGAAGSTGSAGSAAGSNSTSTGAAGSTGSAGSAAGSNSTNTGDAQTSTTLDPAVIATGFANNGQDVPTAGQVASLTSTNNFINFCLTVPNFPITNGQQIKTGSCNPAPMGVIPSTDNMPSAKFAFPTNGAVIQANTAFTITMNIQGMQTGQFVNADENYFAAPQQLNAQGQILGHSHVVVEALSSLTQTTPTTPTNFVFFKGLNDAAANGQLTAAVPTGLPSGSYKLSSINTAANHQPVLVPVAQHGSLDDAVYFTVTDNGQADAGSGAFGGSNSTAAAGSAGASNSTAAAGASNSGTGTAGTAGAGSAGASQNGNAGSTAGSTAGSATGSSQNQKGNGGKAGQNQNNNAGNGGKGNNRGGRNRRFARSRLL